MSSCFCDRFPEVVAGFSDHVPAHAERSFEGHDDHHEFAVACVLEVECDYVGYSGVADALGAVALPSADERELFDVLPTAIGHAAYVTSGASYFLPRQIASPWKMRICS